MRDCQIDIYGNLKPTTIIQKEIDCNRRYQAKEWNKKKRTLLLKKEKEVRTRASKAK